MLTHGGFFREIVLYQRTSPTSKVHSPFVEIGYHIAHGLSPVVLMAGTKLKDHPAHLLNIFAIRGVWH